MKERVAVLLLFTALAVALTWPLARNLGTAVADPGDPYLNIFILDWDWHATFHHPLALFDAPIFYPAKHALAFSENLYGIALFLFPLRALGASPIAAYNVAMLAGFALSGFVVYLLADSVWAGIAAGIFYAFVPFRFTHLSHLQYVWGWTLPLMLYALMRRRPVLFGLAFLLNGLANIHAFLFGCVAMAIVALIVRPPWKPFLAATAISCALLAPFLLPYANGMKRDAREVMHYSADARDWLRNDNAEPERRLFPGYVALVCTAVVLAGWRGGLKVAPVAGSLIALGVLGSLGLHAFFHRFLFAYVPGFSGMRVPARWAMVAYVGIALLIASSRKWLAIAGAIALLVELNQAPIRWHIAVPETPPIYAALDGPAIELPLDPYREYGYMLRVTSHRHPIANGVSGVEPAEHKRLVELAKSDSGAFVDELHRIGIERVIEHGEYKPLPGLTLRAHIGDDYLLGPPAKVVLIGEITTGALFRPAPNETLHGGAFFSGFARSPHGIRNVDLLFNNGAVRVSATRKEGTDLFFAGFDKRPPNIRTHADVQVEITDGRGWVTRLDDVWFEWP